MTSLRPRFVVSPRRALAHRSNPHRRSLVKAGKKFGGGNLGGSFRNNSLRNLGAARFRDAGTVDTATQRGNIQVVVRVRGANASEQGPSRRLIVQAVDDKLVIFDPKEEVSDFYFHGERQRGRDLLRRPNKDQKFVFDRVYGPWNANCEIFDNTIKPTIDALISGCNCSVFAYGATGSGKTYTMLGSHNNPGITCLTVTELYNRMEQMADEYETEIQVSYVEVYNEEVKDLLNPSAALLTVREDGAGGTVIPALTFHKPRNTDDLFDLLKHGNSIRSQHPTDHNAESSRSHAIFQVHVKLRGRFTNMTNNSRTAKLVMVDLAGSERGTATGFKGARFREGSSINKSLLALGNCINALADGKKHVPYRDSKLTRILKDALGGNCKTVMIANVSPSDTSYNETFNTLRYADRAKRIQFHVKKNVMTVHARVAEYAVVVDEMSEQITSLKRQLEAKLATCRCDVLRYNGWCQTDPEEILPVSRTTTPPEVVDLNRTYDGSELVSATPTSLFGNKNTSPPHLNELNLARIPEYVALVDRRRQLQIKISETQQTVHEIETKLVCKKKRVACAEFMDSKDPTVAKGLERTRRQIDSLSSQSKVHKSQENQFDTELSSVQNQICHMEDKCATETAFYSGPPQYTKVGMDEYLHFKSCEGNVGLDFDLKPQHTKTETYLLDEAIRNENLLTDALMLLKTSHLLLKHHGYTTRDNDDKYKDIMADYFGTRIHFADGKENSSKICTATQGAGPTTMTDKTNNGPHIQNQNAVFAPKKSMTSAPNKLNGNPNLSYTISKSNSKDE